VVSARGYTCRTIVWVTEIELEIASPKTSTLNQLSYGTMFVVSSGLEPETPPL
jgi:hypothetical protein